MRWMESPLVGTPAEKHSPHTDHREGPQGVHHLTILQIRILWRRRMAIIMELYPKAERQVIVAGQSLTILKGLAGVQIAIWSGDDADELSRLLPKAKWTAACFLLPGLGVAD